MERWNIQSLIGHIFSGDECFLSIFKGPWERKSRTGGWFCDGSLDLGHKWNCQLIKALQASLWTCRVY